MSAPTHKQIAELACALCEMHPATLWAVGNMEEGPFARLCWPMKEGGYLGGYVEADGDTVADALNAAIARGRALDGAAQ